MKSRRKNKIKKHILVLGVFLVSVSLTILIYFLIYNIKIDYKEKQSIKYYLNNSSVPVNKVEQVSNDNNKDIINYVAVLEIAIINLKRGLVDINSKDNNVNKNIEILKESSMPNVVNGILMLASHSGWGATAYFSKLDKLKVSDNIYVYYGNKKYTYQIMNTYVVKKTGTISIQKEPLKTQLALITCSNYNDTEQLVVMADLINSENYS